MVRKIFALLLALLSACSVGAVTVSDTVQNDAHLYWNGTAYGSISTDISQDWFGNRDGDAYHAAFRFTGLTIPNGATISSATLSMYAGTSLSGTTVNLLIHCEDADNSADFTNVTNFGTRTWTSASASWSPAATTAGSRFNSSDFSSALQSVVNRAGYTSGNAITVLVKNNGSTSNAYRDCNDRGSGAAGTYVAINVTYTAGGSPPATPTTTVLRGSVVRGGVIR